MALETFKIPNKSSPEFIQNIITIKENSYNFRYQNTKVPRIMYKIQNFHSFRSTHKSATSVFGCLAKMSNVEFLRFQVTKLS